MATALSLHHSLLLEVSHTFSRNNHNSKDTQIQHVYLAEDSNMNHHLDTLRPYQHTHYFHSVLYSLDLEDNLRKSVIEITNKICMLITLFKAWIIQLLQFLYLLLVALYFSLPMTMLSSLQLPSINVWLFWTKNIMCLVMYHLNFEFIYHEAHKALYLWILLV